MADNGDTPLVSRRPYAIRRALRDDDPDLRGPQGEQGPQGEKGDQGSAVNIKGTLADETDLPLPGEEGDAYLIAGDLWVWDGTDWTSVGAIQGPQGDQGPTGPTGPQGVQGIPGAPLQIHGIVALESDLPATGAPGDAWFVFPGTLWHWSVDDRWELIGSLLGPQGDKGDKGDKGDTGNAGQGVASGGTAGQLLTKRTGANYDTEWADKPQGTPPGGAVDTVLGKTSATDHDVGWRNSGVPRGGAAGHLLTKTAAGDWAAAWQAPPAGTPAGGTTDQVLGKTSNADQALSWRSAGVPRGGTLGQVLTKSAPTDWALNWTTPAQTPNTAAPWNGYDWPNGSIYHDTNMGHGDTWLFFPGGPVSGWGPTNRVTLAVGDLVIYSGTIMGAYRQYVAGGFALLRGPLRGPGAALTRVNVASNQLSGAYPNALTPFTCPLIGTMRWTATQGAGLFDPGLAAWCVSCRLELHYWSIDVMIWRGLNVVSPMSAEILMEPMSATAFSDELDEKYPAKLRKQLADETYVLAHTWTMKGGKEIAPAAVLEGGSNGN